MNLDKSCLSIQGAPFDLAIKPSKAPNAYAPALDPAKAVPDAAAIVVLFIFNECIH